MKNHFRKILSVLEQEQKKQLGGSIASVLLLGIFDIISIAFLLAFLRFAFLQENGNETFFHRLERFSGINNNHQFILVAGIILLLLFIVKNYFSYLIFHRHAKFVYGIASSFSARLMKRFFNLDYMEYIKGHAGGHTRNIAHVPGEYANHVLLGFITLVSESIILILVMAAMLLYRADVLLLVMLVLFPCIMISYRLTRRKTSNVREGVQQSAQLSMKYLLEALSSYIETKMHGKEKLFTDRYIVKQKNLNDRLADLLAMQYIPNRLLEVFAVTGVILILLIRLAASALNPETFVMLSVFLAATYKTLPSLNRIIIAWGQIRTFEYTIEILQDASMQLNKRQEETVAHEDTIVLKQDIRLEKLTFAYNHNAPVLKELDLHIRKGEITGLTGPSGNGKTTLVNILLLFLKPDSGRIMAGENEITAVDASAWRKGIAYVQQSPFIMAGSLEMNLTLGEDAGKSNSERLERSLRAAGLWDFVNRHPEGIHFNISEAGRNLSGGQKQRLVLARALYQQCPFIILDESLNELEIEMINELGKTLKQIASEGISILIVSHQPQVLTHCHTVYSLAAGKAEILTHLPAKDEHKGNA